MSYRSNADLGGSVAHGAIIQEPEGELFHAPWEPRVLALTLAMTATGLWNLDMNRAARETLVNYRELSYYEIWLAALGEAAGGQRRAARIRGPAAAGAARRTRCRDAGARHPV